MPMKSSVNEALQARFAGRTGLIDTGAPTVDYGAGNNNPELGRNAADTADVEIHRIDASNNHRLFASLNSPTRQPIPLVIPVNASLAANMAQTFYIAQDNIDLSNIFEIHSTAGSDSGAVTLTVSKETGRQAPGAGTVLMTGTFNLKGTANTLQTATLAYPFSHYSPGAAPTSSVSLNANERLSIKITGAVTALVGLALYAYAKPGLVFPFVSKAIFLNADIATQYIYVANNQRTITGVKLVAAVGGSVVGTVTADITKESSTTAPGGGTSVLGAAINVSSTYVANTVTSPALAASAATLAMAAGDRLSLKMTGTLTALAGLFVVVFFAPTFDRCMDFTMSCGPNALQSDRTIMIADRGYELIDLSEVHGTAAGGALTGNVTQDTGTTAPGAGTTTQTGTFDLNGTANTVAVGVLASLRVRTLQRGDRLGWHHSTTVQALANTCVTATVRPI